MREKIIRDIRSYLIRMSQFFTREQDIQIQLAMKFSESKEFDNVFLEYHVPTNRLSEYPWKGDSIYIDIVLEQDGQYFPIELKFKTRSQPIHFKLFGSQIELNLGQQGATNIGCYDFWKDIKRLELVESTFRKCEQGICVFITNDSKYLEPPTQPNFGYAQFSIHEQRVTNANDILEWNGSRAASKGRPPIQLKRAYKVEWVEMNLASHFFTIN